MEQSNQPIVFGFYVKDELKGFRADTMGTLSMTQPKIYHYSKEQVEIVLGNVRGNMNKQGTSFMKFLAGGNFTFINANKVEAVESIDSAEDEIRSWGEFEMRVLPFIGYDGDWGYPEQWKVKAAIAELKEPIEVHKFKILDHEN